MASLMLQVRSVFDAVQDGMVVSKGVENLNKLKEGGNTNEFWEAFLNHIQKAMIYYKAEPAVERIMEFIARFATFPLAAKRKEKKDDLTLSNDSLEDSEDDQMDEFLLQLFTYLLDNHNARDKAVRYRVCQLVNKLFNYMGDEDSVDEDLADRVYDCMLLRIKDRFAPIRIQAVLALVRLQDPGDESCPVIDAFIHSMQTDSNSDVRKTVLMNIALSRKTLPYLIERTRDVRDLNRKAAYTTMATKVSIRALTIAQRIDIMKSGLKDRTEAVRQACVQLLKAWLKSYEYKVVPLLTALDTENATDVSELVLSTLLKDAPREKILEHVNALKEIVAGNEKEKEKKMLGYDALNPETVLYWCILTKHIKNLGHEYEEMLEQLLPEMSAFCDYIQGYTEQSFIDSALLTAFEGGEGQSEFILEQLLKILGLLDYSDEVGRRRVKQLVHDLLITETVPLSLTSELVARYVDAEPNKEAFIQALVEIIADIKEPMVQVITTAMKESNRRIELQLARLRVNLNEAKEELDNMIRSQKFDQAAMLKNQITELEEEKTVLQNQLSESNNTPTRVERDDPETMLKCMTVASCMLDRIENRGITPVLATLKEELIFQGVQNEDPFTRNAAVKCLGQLSLLNKEFACQHLVLFLQVAQVDQELLQITAVQIIVDLFLVYGIEAFQVDDENQTDTTLATAITTENGEMDNEDGEKTIIAETPPEEMEEQGEKDDTQQQNAAQSILEILVLFLDDESSELRTVVAEGLAKLLISRRIVSAKVLVKLILLWYNPVTEDDTKLRHCLGVAFSVFSFESRTNQKLIEEAFMPIMRTLFNAPQTSPLSQVNIANVAELLVQLTDVRNLAQYNQKGAQESTAKSQSSTILSLPDTSVHDSLSLKLANEILSDPEDPNVKLMCRILNMLYISPKNTLVIQDLIQLSSQMISALESNKVVKKMIEKLQLRLEALNQGVPVVSTAPSEASSQDTLSTKGDEGKIVEQDEEGDEGETFLKGDEFNKSDHTLISTEISTAALDMCAAALQKQKSEPRSVRAVRRTNRSSTATPKIYGPSDPKKAKTDSILSADIDFNIGSARSSRSSRQREKKDMEDTRKNLESVLIEDENIEEFEEDDDDDKCFL